MELSRRKPMFASGPPPGAMLAHALVAALGQRIDYEWSSGALRAGRLDRSRGPSLVAMPRDFRPADPEVGRALLHEGDIVLVLWLGETHYPLTGDEATERFMAASAGFAQVRHQSRAPEYRLDVLHAVSGPASAGM